VHARFTHAHASVLPLSRLAQMLSLDNWENLGINSAQALGELLYDRRHLAKHQDRRRIADGMIARAIVAGRPPQTTTSTQAPRVAHPALPGPSITSVEQMAQLLSQPDADDTGTALWLSELGKPANQRALDVLRQLAQELGALQTAVSLGSSGVMPHNTRAGKRAWSSAITKLRLQKGEPASRATLADPALLLGVLGRFYGTTSPWSYAYDLGRLQAASQRGSQYAIAAAFLLALSDALPRPVIEQVRLLGGLFGVTGRGTPRLGLAAGAAGVRDPSVALSSLRLYRPIMANSLRWACAATAHLLVWALRNRVLSSIQVLMWTSAATSLAGTWGRSGFAHVRFTTSGLDGSPGSIYAMSTRAVSVLADVPGCIELPRVDNLSKSQSSGYLGTGSVAHGVRVRSLYLFPLQQLVGRLGEWLWNLKERKEQELAVRAAARTLTQPSATAEASLEVPLEASALAGSDVTLLSGLGAEKSGRAPEDEDMSRYVDLVVDARGADLTGSEAVGNSVAQAARYAWVGGTLANAIRSAQELGQTEPLPGWQVHLVDVQMALSQLLAMARTRSDPAPLLNLLQRLEVEQRRPGPAGPEIEADMQHVLERTRRNLTLPRVPRKLPEPVLPYPGAAAPIHLEMLRVLVRSQAELYEINISDMQLLLQHCYGNLAEQLALMEVENARFSFGTPAAVSQAQLAAVPEEAAVRVRQGSPEETRVSPLAEPGAFGLIESPKTPGLSELLAVPSQVTPLAEATRDDPYEQAAYYSAYEQSEELTIAGLETSFYEPGSLELSPSRLSPHQLLELETTTETTTTEEGGEVFVHDPFDMETFLNP